MCNYDVGDVTDNNDDNDDDDDDDEVIMLIPVYSLYSFSNLYLLYSIYKYLNTKTTIMITVTIMIESIDNFMIGITCCFAFNNTSIYIKLSIISPT